MVVEGIKDDLKMSVDIPVFECWRLCHCPLAGTSSGTPRTWVENEVNKSYDIYSARTVASIIHPLVSHSELYIATKQRTHCSR